MMPLFLPEKRCQFCARDVGTLKDSFFKNKVPDAVVQTFELFYVLQ